MSYPIAFVKQVDYQSTKTLNDKKSDLLNQKFIPELAQRIQNIGARCDFEVMFNANRKWYFGNGTIDGDQADFKLVAAKEITKGLGFISNLVQLPYKDSNLIVPGFYFDDKNPKTIYMRYMSPMDSLTSSAVRGLRNLAKYCVDSLLCRESDALTKPEPVSATFTKFEQTGLYGKNFANYNNTKTESRNYLLTGMRLAGEGLNPILTFDNGGQLALASVHSGELNSGYWDSSDYLMTPESSIMTGVTLKEKMARYRYLYGRGALSILEYIGYSTYARPSKFQFED